MRRTRSTGVASLLAAAAVVLGPSATALAAPPPNDDYTGATVLSDLTALNADTSEATDASGEPLTEGGNGTCGPSTKLGQTVWYKVRRSSAGPISINTFGSSFDTVIAVYDTDGTATPGNGPPTISNAFLCSNDAADFSFGASRM